MPANGTRLRLLGLAPSAKLPKCSSNCRVGSSASADAGAAAVKHTLDRVRVQLVNGPGATETTAETRRFHEMLG